MKTNKMHVAMLAGGIGVALMLSGLAHAGDGSLMEVTTTIKQSMSGMPAMPSRTMTHKVCSVDVGHAGDAVAHDDPQGLFGAGFVRPACAKQDESERRVQDRQLQEAG
jgi:hypothetical protein